MIALTFAACFSLVVVLIGVRRHWKDGPRALAAPAVIPAAYVATTTVWSTAWIYQHGELGRAKLVELSADTAVLVSLSVVGFVLGTAFRFRPPGKPTLSKTDPLTMVMMGRTLICFPLLLTGLEVFSGAVNSRGVNQLERGLGDSLVVASSISAMVSLALIAMGRESEKRLYAKFDWVAILGLAVLTGLTGERGRVLTLTLIILILWLSRTGSKLQITRKRLALVAVMAPVALAVFSTQTLEYRSGAQEASENSAAETLVRDWSSVPFTTGHVAKHVETGGSMSGATIAEAAVRQLPAPIANEVFGPAENTGTLVFREIIGFTYENHGFGFSLPAEGVLNFGSFGAFVLPFAGGLSLSFLFSRLNLARGTATSVIYVIAAATVPIAWRSDLVGVLKSSLYPFIFLAVLLVIARSFWKAPKKRGVHSDRV